MRFAALVKSQIQNPSFHSNVLILSFISELLKMADNTKSRRCVTALNESWSRWMNCSIMNSNDQGNPVPLIHPDVFVPHDPVDFNVFFGLTDRFLLLGEVTEMISIQFRTNFQEDVCLFMTTCMGLFTVNINAVFLDHCKTIWRQIYL